MKYKINPLLQAMDMGFFLQWEAKTIKKIDYKCNQS